LKSLAAFILFFLFPALLSAGEWIFDEKVPISLNNGTGIFHHLESSGRKNIAVNDSVVVVVWEDNHSGSPQIYAAFKTPSSNNFSKPEKLSTGNSAFEPTVVGVVGGFIAAWEQEGEIWARKIQPDSASTPVKLSVAPSTQVSIAANNHRVVAAWVQKQEKYRQIVASELEQTAIGIEAGTPRTVDTQPPAVHQQYPSLALTDNTIAITWEDRRRGHTALFSSYAKNLASFSKPKLLNEIVKKSEKYGKGSGVTRTALVLLGNNRVAATWMDKRGTLAGYDIYAAFSDNGGKSWGKNQKVQDEFGNDIAQWNPAIAGGPNGTVVIAWDDNRDDSSDIWLSWKSSNSNWSEDVTSAPACGPGDQTNPVIALDNNGNLHMAWLDKQEDGVTRLFYSKAEFRN